MTNCVSCVNRSEGRWLVDLVVGGSEGHQRAQAQIIIQTARALSSVLCLQVSSRPAGDWWSRPSVWVSSVLYLPSLEWSAPKSEERTKSRPRSPALLELISFLVVSTADLCYLWIICGMVFFCWSNFTFSHSSQASARCRRVPFTHIRSQQSFSTQWLFHRSKHHVSVYP